MDRREKILFEMGQFVLILLIFASATGAIFAHLKLGQINSPLTDVAAMFSEDIENEIRLLKNIRLIGAICFVGITVASIPLDIQYFKRIEDPIWEGQKSTGIGILLIVAGSILFLVASTQDFPLPLQAFQLGIAVTGLFVTLFSAGFLVMESIKEEGVKSDVNGSYCSNCGNSVSGSDEYCSECGQQL